MFNSYLYINDIANRMSLILKVFILAIATVGLYACDSEPPKLMKAVKQFDSDAQRTAHIDNMRKNHKDLLRHKRDETVIKGIRTEEHSLKACINCHVPAEYNGKILRHSDPKHFCATCHNYVAAKPDCFQCHVDHPVSNSVAQANSKVSTKTKPITQSLMLGSMRQANAKPLAKDKLVINTTSELSTAHKIKSNTDVIGESRSE